MEGNNCTGECLKCSAPQQIYCASRISYATMKNQEAIVARLDRLDRALALLSPPAEGMINPLNDGAQMGAGAENRALPNNIIQ